MKIVRFERGGRAAWGALEGDGVTTLLGLDFGAAPPALEGERIGMTGMKLLAPVQPSRNVFCLGRNYAEHVREGKGALEGLPKAPIWFSKVPTTISDPDAEVAVDPTLTSELDWEVELAVIIGRGGKHIPEERALEHVFGYSVLNDLSARDLQFARGGQWFYGKNLDGLCPIGPCLVTADEIFDPQSLDICLRVNGEERQRANTADMIFTVAVAIADLSRGITLLPGDVIATGTPAGTGMGMKPPVYLQDGDIVEAEIERVGVLRNRIVLREGA